MKISENRLNISGLGTVKILTLKIHTQSIPYIIPLNLNPTDRLVRIGFEVEEKFKFSNKVSLSLSLNQTDHILVTEKTEEYTSSSNKYANVDVYGVGGGYISLDNECSILKGGYFLLTLLVLEK
jgi:hypothetical protein